MLLFAFSLVYLSPGLGHFSGLLDEGLILTPADRVCRGEHLYRDIYLYLTPLSVYLMAAFLKLLGPSLLAAQIALWLVRSLSVSLYYLVAAQVMPRTVALVSALAYLFWFLPETVNYNYHWIANLFLLLALWLLLRWQNQPTPTRLVLVGLGSALTVWTFQVFGVLIALAALVVVTASGRLRRAGWLGLGLIAGLAPPLIWLWVQGDGTAFLRDVVASNLYRTRLEYVPPGMAVNRLVATFRSGWPASGQVAVLLAAIGIGLFGPFLRLQRHPKLATIYLVNALTLLTCSYKMMPSQLLMHGHLLLLLSIWVLFQIRGYLVGLALLPFLALAWHHLQVARSFRYPVYFARGVARTRYHAQARSLQRLVDLLERQTVGRRRVFFAPYEPMLYFLMDLHNPTRYDLLRPLQNSPAQMEEARARLRGVQVFRFPAYDDIGFLRTNWPNIDFDSYQTQTQDFYRKLQQTHRFIDFGAVQGFYPR